MGLSRVRAGEGFFQPRLNSSTGLTVHELMAGSVQTEPAFSKRGPAVPAGMKRPLRGALHTEGMMTRYRKRQGGDEGVKQRSLMILMALVMLMMTAAGGAAAEDVLRGYDSAEGYIYVTLGKYPQVIDGGTPDEGINTWNWRAHYQKHKNEELMCEEEINPEAVPDSPILWRVLAADEEKVFLLSEYILFPSPMHESDKHYQNIGHDYGNTDLCAKLNGAFAEHAFTEAEMAMFQPYMTYGKIFILGAEELKDKSLGFGTNKSRKAWATEYSIRACGGFVYRTAVGNSSPYWLRDQSKNNTRAARCTKQDGDIGYYNCRNPEEGARPAVHMTQGTYRIAGGSGTKEDPYVITAK